MLLKDFFAHANWMAIIVAALVYFLLGAIWFSALFGKIWAAEHKIEMPTTPEGKSQMKKMMPMMMIKTLIMNILMAIVIGMFVMALGSVKCMAGMKLGLALSAVAVIPMVMGHMYTMKSLKLCFIDASYHIISITLMAIIIAVWHH